MSDFAAGIRQAVQVARGATRQQHDGDRRAREEAAEQQEQNQRRAAELAGLIWERVRAAAHAGDGAIVADRNSGVALTTFHLWWEEDQPERVLQIVVDRAAGMIQASWIVVAGSGQPVDPPWIEASRFDMAKLDATIELLVDQRSWTHGTIPKIAW